MDGWSSDTDNEETGVVLTQRGRKNIRRIKELQDLKLDTVIANRNENERILRIQEKERKFKEVLESNLLENELILDYDFVNNVPLVSVHEALVRKMKPHQKEGVRFMWNACYESLEQIQQSQGSGCIIAHCMGLGKTFQVIALVHTLLNHLQVQTRKVLIFCPKNTLMNWINEFEKWITPDLGSINVFNPTRYSTHPERLAELSKWNANGGVCIINYELMRILLEDEKNNADNMRTKFYDHLCNPGPDLVICDEGHVLKNEDTKLSKAMTEIRTMRRIVLTGTPMQNNLKEYHCMVQFVKPSLLGSRNEFVNMFVNPILNGQYENSSVEDVQLMKERSHVLYKKLLGCVQRFDLSTLKTFLPEKKEYVISIALTDAQIKVYKYYLENYSAKGDPNCKNDGVALFADYQSLQRIWTHPYTLKDHAERLQENGALGKKKSSRKKRKRVSDSEEEWSESEKFQWTRVPLYWWVRFATVDDMEDARQSNKLTLLLRILKECEEANEKILVFSGSRYSLRLIQYFLEKINTSEFEDSCLCNMTSSWEEEADFVVLTGDTSSEDRDRYCKAFNDVHNPSLVCSHPGSGTVFLGFTKVTDCLGLAICSFYAGGTFVCPSCNLCGNRLRLFLISTKAGGMGINLTAASRAILFDVSWNPSHDIQSIFRIYRIGQKKPCFVYRFVTSGTMEEKIYERQVAKQSISHRVVDEKQIARHFTQKELLQLYLFEPNKGNKMKDVQPKDPLLQTVFQEESKKIVGIHEHDSLLEHKKEEELQELEKNDAWLAYNNEDDLNKLPQEERTMLSLLTPESFDPRYFRLALREEYPKATDEELSSMMEELIPRVKTILERPDFVDIMKRQALVHHMSNRVPPTKRTTGKQPKRGTNRKTFEDKENTTIDLTESPVPSAGTSRGRDSDSGDEDSVFLYDVGWKRKENRGRRRRRRRSRPLKVWGVRNGRTFGSPERDS